MKAIHGLLLATSLASALAGAAVLKTDPAKSSVTATFKQMGVPVEAKFKQFTAQIDYDAAKPAASLLDSQMKFVWESGTGQPAADSWLLTRRRSATMVATRCSIAGRHPRITRAASCPSAFV